MKQRLATQFDLFVPARSGLIPVSIEQELVDLLAQMLQATILGDGNPTEVRDEQAER